MHLAGATVFRGPLGFGHSTKVHSTSLFRLSRDLPVVIEIVDTQDKIDSFLPVLSEMMPRGVVTLEKAKILRYGPTHTHSDGADPLHK
jgi:PII-like signaling protein